MTRLNPNNINDVRKYISAVAKLIAEKDYCIKSNIEVEQDKKGENTLPFYNPVKNK